MRFSTLVALGVTALVAVSGCGHYRWTPSVPEGMRTVAVPVFRNESEVSGLGREVTRQVLREFEREGTFRIAAVGESAVEVQGVVKSGSTKVVAYERKTGQRNLEHRLSSVALVSVIDKRSGKVLVNDRKYVATTTFVGGGDMLTGAADASGRLAEDFARQIVDDVLSMDFGGKTGGAR